MVVLLVFVGVEVKIFCLFNVCGIINFWMLVGVLNFILVVVWYSVLFNLSFLKVIV